MSEQPPPLDYASPGNHPPRRDYRGCLLPLGLFVGCFGLYIFLRAWRPSDMSPGERGEEIMRLVSFTTIALFLIIVAVIWKNNE